MITSVSLQYAKALFDLGLEKNIENQYYENLKFVCNVLNNDERIWKVLNHPKINLDERKKILHELFKDNVKDEFIYFLFVLIDNARLNEIHDIVESYEHYLNELNHICNVEVYTKYAMLDEEKRTLIEKLEHYFNKKINLKCQLNENLLGGIVINVDGKVLDYSMLNQIINLRNELKKGW